METYYRYFTIVSISIAVLYLAYFVFFRKENDFRKIRFFVLSAMLFSLLLPLSPASIDITDYLSINDPITIIKNTENNTNLIAENTELLDEPIDTKQPQLTQKNQTKTLNINQLITIIYLFFAGLLILRMILSIVKMLHLFINAEKKQHHKYTLILLDKRIIAFSFFNWIFIDKLIDNEELKQIIAHEKAHADQYHTFDLLFSELLVAAMWFNPFVWMFKKALTQVHEYLADEQVLDSGCNRLDYQRLLVNQAAEERLVAVSSNFSYSLIKKRIMMMSKTKTHGRTGMKFLALIPIIAALIFSVACFNQPLEASNKIDPGLKAIKNTIPKTENTKNDVVEAISPRKKPHELNNKINLGLKTANDTTPGTEKANNQMVAAISPTKMNVLYIGVDNPVSIAVTGAQKEKIKVSISNGTIFGENGQYIVRVKQPGKTTITVTVDNNVVSKQDFRIKMVPDPVAVVKGTWNVTELTKAQLIDAGGMAVMLFNFDFDLKFQIVSFNVLATYNNMAEDARSTSDMFTNQQIDLINKVPIGSKIYIEDIKAKGPDGTVRTLAPLIIKIK